MPVWSWPLIALAVFAALLAWRVVATRRNGRVAVGHGAVGPASVGPGAAAAEAPGQDIGWQAWGLVAAVGAGLSLSGFLLSVVYAEQLAELLELVTRR
ncbi:hypothetical protein ACX8Z9_06540 [Arthrobacter halodurans]|uniref:Uncharacterized protein n=1 Tax=Arthrobacter halodurans TaxID=516699 RepID=A0ABV4ULH3_9MICC